MDEPLGGTMAAEFRLLGSIEALVNAEPIPIGYAQLQCALAVLLVEANTPVSVDQMVDRVWGTRQLPRRPQRAVQHAMTLLRRALQPATDVTIIRRSAGYQLTVDADTVDIHRFHTLLDNAHTAASEDHAAALVEQALRLWRGEPCTGLRTPWLDALRATLGTRRQAARLDLTDIQLRQGRHSALLADLAGQTEQQPLDERLAGQYLLALYRSGRQADALRYYHHLRHRLAEELGADPGPPLQQLHHRILTADPALAAPTPPDSGTEARERRTVADYPALGSDTATDVDATPSMVRVFLAEDQVMVRSALVSLIDLEDDLEVIGIAGRGDEAVDRIVELRPDIAVLDIDMPGVDGLAAAATLAERVPGCAVLILTALNKPGLLQRALQAKARGFVVKYAPVEQLLTAIRDVAAGQRVFDSTLAVAALDADIPVTQRELEVVRLVAEGASTREIANRLFLSEGMVRSYTSSLINKSGARNRVDLVRIAFDCGWL